MQVSADDPNLADPDGAEVISFRTQPYPNHIGGDLEFGPDGCLYIGHGDGGLEGDPLDAGQDLTTHLGKILRIDLNPSLGLPPCGKGSTPATAEEATAAAASMVHEDNTHMVSTGGPGKESIGENYAIPADNPFIAGDDILNLSGLTEDDFARYHPYARPEIWAFGIRNPWQFSFDRETGDLWIGDVGQNFWEEIDFEPASSEGGFNYSWKFLQGSHCFPDSLNPDCPKVGVLPVAEYPHDEDEAGNIYFTSCECGYGQVAPNLKGSLWMLVAADQVPEGAEVAPVGQQQANQEETEEIEGATPAP
jgi:hypothetical protein